MTSEFDLSAYDYELPEELIAQRPAEPRDSSRLLVIHRAENRWEHRTFRDLPEYLIERDLLVANNTRVIKARLLGKRIRDDETNAKHRGTESGKIEFVLLEELEPLVWEGLFHAAAKHRPGVCFEIPTPDGKGLRGELIRGASESPHGTVVARFDRDPVESGAGELPLPKYIKRPDAVRAEDHNDYQTIFAKMAGSAAAPTAGLHFTPEVLARLASQGIERQEVTLHVGLGTFRPVKDEDIRKHVMHEERFDISPEVAAAITSAKGSGRKILAVGTTSVRTLESAWGSEGLPGGSKEGLRAGPGRTSIFIHPGYRFQVVDRMLTNFHLPRSTLLMLVSAFAGRELVLNAYKDAVKERYRFFSYGDAMLLL